MSSKTDIQAQLNGKAHGSASEAEMRDWLATKCGIHGDEAESMIAVAMREKAAAVRKRSLFRATVGAAFAIPLLVMGWFAGESENARISTLSHFILGGGIACLCYAGKNLFQALTGKSDVSIDAQ